MKNISPELLALYATREFIEVPLYTISGGNLGSTVLRFTGGDTDVVANGFTYYSGRATGPYWDRKDNKAKAHWKIGTEVDTLVIDCVPGNFHLFGIPFQAAVRQSFLDGSEFMIERCPMPIGSYGPQGQLAGFQFGDTRRGTVREFVGRVANVDAGRSVMTFAINSHLELLNLQLPRNLFQPSCVNVLGDTACAVNLATYSFTGVVAAGSNTLQILTSSSPFATDTQDLFGLGRIVFTSGVNDGLSMGILSNSPGALNMLAKLPSTPSAGDTFTATYGCDKTLGADGCPKFSNQARYRGERLVPQPSGAILAS